MVGCREGGVHRAGGFDVRDLLNFYWVVSKPSYFYFVL